MLENLTKLGFTEKEAKVYLILLRNGPALASTLALRAGLKRVSMYSILESLTARGIVSYENTPLGRRYLPHDPECLLYPIERERAELQVKWDLAKNCIDSLATLTVQKMDARRVVFLRESSAILDAMDELFEKGQKLYGAFSVAFTSSEKNFFIKLLSVGNFSNKESVFLAPETPSLWFKTKLNITCFKHPFPTEKGHILVQGAKVFFICERENLELMLIRDASYAKAVLDVLIKPYCSSAGELALSSNISFLKG